MTECDFCTEPGTWLYLLDAHADMIEFQYGGRSYATPVGDQAQMLTACDACSALVEARQSKALAERSLDSNSDNPEIQEATRGVDRDVLVSVLSVHFDAMLKHLVGERVSDQEDFKMDKTDELLLLGDEVGALKNALKQLRRRRTALRKERDSLKLINAVDKEHFALDPEISEAIRVIDVMLEMSENSEAEFIGRLKELEGK